MKYKKLFLSFIFVFVLAINLFAIPASKTPITIKQTNGKTLSFILQGDEKLRWAISLDSYTLLTNKDGHYVYAILDENEYLIPSNVLASNEEERDENENIFLVNINKGLFFNPVQIQDFKQVYEDDKLLQKKPGDANTSPISQVGNKEMLIILVDFQDKPFTYSRLDFDNKYNQIGCSDYNATGSAKDYYYDCSRGQLNINFTVVGPYTLSNNLAYYGSSSSGHDSNPKDMAKEAVLLANLDVDFSKFDKDGDGYVDFIHIIFAGTSEAETGITDDIWPHSWNFKLDTTLDGMSFYKYSCSNEKRKSGDINGIGVACHEIGHDLGLPDYYDTDYFYSGGKSYTLGTWDLMDGGSYNNDSNTPPFMNSFSAHKLGWIDLPELTPGDYAIHAITDSAHAYKITLSEDEFFVIEHRRKKKWDTYLKGEGLVIYHGDHGLINPWFESRKNTINVNPNDRGFFFEPSSGNIAEINSSNLPFSNLTSPAFTDITLAKTRLKNGLIVNTPITYINYEDSILVFKYQSLIGQIINLGHDVYSTDSNRANVSASIAHLGEFPLIEKGFIWSIDTSKLNYENARIHIDYSNDILFTAKLNNLPGNAKRVYYKPYMLYSDTIVYGNYKSLLSKGNEIGLEEIKNEINLSIYPNPTTNHVWISLSRFENSSYEIYNIQGKLIKTSTKLYTPQTRIDLSNIPKGVYLIKVRSEKNTIIEKLIIH